MCNSIDGVASSKQKVSKLNWRAPTSGCIKINVDVAIDDALGGFVCIGVVALDD